MNAHSSIHLASVTKTFTAMAILKLQEMGRLNINDSVSQYLPGFPYPQVSIAMLLNHRSGLPNYVHQLTTWGWPENRMATNHDLLQLLIQVKPPMAFAPNTRFAYCNTNYAVLALVIEKAGGLPYPQWLKRHLFDPAGMLDTYVFQPADTLRALPSYDWKRRLIPFNYLDGIYGDKNIYSTVRDLYKWDQLLYSNTFLSQASLHAAYTPYSFEKPGIKNYGLGWRMYLFPNNKKIIFHNGWWHGNNTAFQRLVQDSATIICLGSQFSRTNYSVLQLSYLFGDYPFEIEAEEGADSTQQAAADSLLLKTIRLRADTSRFRKKTVPPAKKPTPPDSLKKETEAEKPRDSIGSLKK
jgi:CubicO group peptidase (beta-lactamase class C family)